MDVVNCAWRQSLASGQESEFALRVAGQSAVETNPDVAEAVFAKRTRQVVLEPGQPATSRQVVNASVERFPTGKTVRDRASG